MEEVSFNSHGTKYVLVDGQAVILQKNLQLNNIPDVNVDILQGALNGVNISPSNKNVGCLQSSLSSNGLNCIGNNEFVIVNEAQKTESDKIVQLSIQETNDLGLQFSMEASEIKGSTPKEGSQNDLSESYFYQNPVNINESVNDEGAINVQNVLDIGNYNDLMLPALSDNVNQQVTLIPHYVNGQLSYTLQLNDQNNPFDFTQIQSIGNDNILNSTGVNEITEKNVPMTNLLKCTPISIAPLLPNLDQSSTLEKVIASAGFKTNGAITSHEPTIVNQGKEPVTYILPAKALLTNSKPRIIASTKNSQHNIIKLMEANKNIQPKVKIQPSKNQLLLLSNKRKIAPLKMALPPLNPSIKKRNLSSGNPKQVLIKSILKNDSSNSTINTNLSNNILKQQFIAGKSVIAPKNIESVSKGNVRLNIKNDVEVSVPKEDFIVTAPSSIELDGKEVQSSDVNDKQPIRRLTQSQLKQIASVLQKSRNNQGGLTTPSTLYDTETNTRIICRVVYPEDFGSENKTHNLAKKRGRPSKCKEPSEVSSEKKPSCEERKKQSLSRTRSGRLSRPPRHMVKDYKRLQGDDSDDAYSDYVSEAEENSENTVAVNLLPGLCQRQKRNISSQFRCPTCNKIYLGHERMRWHFEKYPDHGDDKYMNSLPPPLPEIEGVNNTKPTINRKGFGLTRGRRRFKRLHPESLKDVIKSCDDDEVVGAAGSTVAKVLTAWELLLLRLDAVRNDKSRVATLCEELNNIVQKVREAAEHFLQPKLNSDHEGETFSGYRRYYKRGGY